MQFLYASGLHGCDLAYKSNFYMNKYFKTLIHFNIVIAVMHVNNVSKCDNACIFHTY